MPFRNRLFLNSKVELHEYNCKIYTADGKVVAQYLISGITDIKFDRSKFGSGLYFLELTDNRNKTVFFQKVLKYWSFAPTLALK